LFIYLLLTNIQILHPYFLKSIQINLSIFLALIYLDSKFVFTNFWHAQWDFSTSHIFLQVNKFYIPLKKTWLPKMTSFNLRRRKLSDLHLKDPQRLVLHMARSMTKVAASITLKQQVMAPTWYSYKFKNFAPTCLLMESIELFFSLI